MVSILESEKKTNKTTPPPTLFHTAYKAKTQFHLTFALSTHSQSLRTEFLGKELSKTKLKLPG